jgi:hypothetical protein
MAEQEMPARTAARFVHDELLLDGTPALNLASFVTTYMEEEAEKLMVENLSKVCSSDNCVMTLLIDALSRTSLTLRSTLLLERSRLDALT